MYQYLSQFLSQDLAVLSYCLEVKIADELESILSKLAKNDLDLETAHRQIKKILKNAEVVNFETSTEIENPKEIEENLENDTESEAENFSLDLESEENSHLATASLRAPAGYHLPDAMKSVQEKHKILEKFGGHPGAAGFSARPTNLEKIKQKLSAEIASQNTTQTNPVSFVNKSFKVKIPAFLKTKTYQKNLIWLNLKELNLQFLREVCLLEPFGQDFAMPNFIFQVPIINSKLQGKKYFNEFAQSRQKKLGALFFWLGKEQKHIKIEVNDVKITIFGISDFLKEKLNNPQDEVINIWLECRISQNTWQSKTTLELLAQEVWLE